MSPGTPNRSPPWRGVSRLRAPMSKELELISRPRRRRKEVRAQAQALAVHFKTLHGEPEAHRDLSGVGTGSRLPQPELRDVILAAVHRSENADHVLGPVRKLGHEPFAKQLLQLER